jgi:hypothetical protein
MKNSNVGTFLTTEGGYGSIHQLEDGTIVNVVTIFTGPGLGCDTEIEAERKLTEEEIDMVMDADSSISDHGQNVTRPKLPIQHRF